MLKTKTKALGSPWVLAGVLAVMLGVTNEAAAQVVKKSSSGVCHCPGGQFYERTTNFTEYETIEACLDSDGREPQRGQGDCSIASANDAPDRPPRTDNAPAGSQVQPYGQSASDNAALESYRWRVVMYREGLAVARDNLDFATRHLGDAELAVTEARNPETAAKQAEIEDEIEKHHAEWEELLNGDEFSLGDSNRFAARADELRELQNQYPKLASAERHLSVSSALMLAAQSVLAAQEAAIVSAEALVATAEAASVSGDTTRLNVTLSAANAVLKAVAITLTERDNISETDASTHSSPAGRERRWPRGVDSGSLANAWSSAARAAERAQEIMAALNSGNGAVPPELLEPLPSEPFSPFSVVLTLTSRGYLADPGETATFCIGATSLPVGRSRRISYVPILTTAADGSQWAIVIGIC